MTDAQSPPPAAPATAPSPPTWSTTHWFAIAALACAVIGPDALWWAQAVGHEYARWTSWPAIAGAVTCAALLIEVVALLVRRDHGYLRPALVLVAGGVVFGKTVASLGGFNELMDFLNQMGVAIFGGREGLSGRGYAMLAMLAAAAAGAYMGLLRLLHAQAKRSAKNPALARRVFYYVLLIGTAGPAIWFVVSLFGSIFFKNMGDSDAQAVQGFMSRKGWGGLPAVIFAGIWLRYAVAVWKDSSRWSVGLHAAIGGIAATCAFPAILMSFAMVAYAAAGNLPGKPVAILQLVTAIFLISLPIVAGMATLRFGAISVAAMVRRAAGLAGAPATPVAPAPTTTPSSPGWLASLFVRALPAPATAVATAAPTPSAPAPAIPAITPVDAPALALVPVSDDILDLVVADLLAAGVDFHIASAGEGIEVDEGRVDHVMQIVAKHQRPAPRKAAV